MTTHVDIAAAPRGGSIIPRVFAILSLAAVTAGVGSLARGAYLAATDAWMAPITLSSDNDQVLQINIKLNEQMVQRDRYEADIVRIDADLAGIDVAVRKLETIQADDVEALRWSKNATELRAAAVGARQRALFDQNRLLNDMLSRQRALQSSAQRNAASGLGSRQEADRDAQSVDELRLALSQNLRESSEARAESAELGAARSALGHALGRGSATGIGLMPEVAAVREQEVRIELELIKLGSERRALTVQRDLAIESLERMEEVFTQLRSRPLYRAIEAKTDVAFVPYSQLEGVEEGSELVTCSWLLFGCEVVGHVSEILPGEVVALDPWSDTARGQYAILTMTKPGASQQKVLRARARR